MLKNGKVQAIEIPKNVFSESFNTFLMKKIHEYANFIYGSVS